MAKIYSTIDDRLKAFIEGQRMFFVATAPSTTDGHINLSPKGIEALRVTGDQEVAYLDFIGSGVETIAHIRENGRIVVMLCAFEGPPNIIRLHGRGAVVEPQDPDFERLTSIFGPNSERRGVRAIVRVEVERISDSCGYGVPLYDYKGQRSQLSAWADHRSDDELKDYQRQKNAKSLDGLPGLRWPSAGE